jgi:LacI family transcriptional regulator
MGRHHTFSVALLVETSNAYSRGLLDGVIEYVKQHGRWSVFLTEQERGAAPPSWLARWKGDGIIARIETDAIARTVMRMKLPTVDLSAARRVPHIPWADTDDEAIAQLAVEHFVERGFMNLAFCGDPAFAWSQARAAQFARLAERAGRRCFHYDGLPRYSPDFQLDREKKQLGRWLRLLPRPVAIMACYDFKAHQLLDVCRALRIAVPEEVAVLGVDNDRMLCEFAAPPLSSIIPNTRQTGYEAAECLDRWMLGEQVPERRLLTKPLGICVRQSTDILAIEDRDVVAALRYIREHACLNIRVSDILARVPISRRILESRFQKLLGRTPHEEILRLRLNRVQQLLRETNWSIGDIAQHTGFEHAEYLSAAFKRELGRPPSQYRREMKGLP